MKLSVGLKMLTALLFVLLATDGHAQGIWINVTNHLPLSTENINKISCPSANTCYAIAAGSVIKTKDGGNTWVATTVPGATLNFSGYSLSALTCTDTSTCYGGGFTGAVINSANTGFITKTSDGGSTWNTTAGYGRWAIRAIHMEGSTGYAVGDSGFVMTTTNTGAVWTIVASVSTSGHSTPSLRAVSYGGQWFAVGFNGSVVTQNNNWNATFVRTFYTAPIWDAASTSYSNFAVGDSGYLLTDKGAYPSWNTARNNYAGLGNKRALLSISFPNPKIGYIGGDSGMMAKSADSGVTWTRQSTGLNSKVSLNSISCPDTTVCYAGGVDNFSDTAVFIKLILPPSDLSYSQNPATYVAGAAIAPDTAKAIGSVTNYSINPALPAGLSLNTTTGIISGTPTVKQAAANYTITETNAGGSSSMTLSISVLGISYATTPVTYTRGLAIANNAPTIIGTAASFSVAPPLPSGLLLNTTTGVISGAATTTSVATNYTVTATNSSGSTTATINITVIDPPSNLTYSTNPANYQIGSAISSNNPSVTGLVASYSVSPALPAGLTLNTTTGVITGAPTTASAAANYTVTANNGVGGTTIAILSIAILTSPSGLVYASNPAKYTVGISATNNPTFTGTSPVFSVSPTLPVGLSINTATGVISGTPTSLSSAANYTITLTNSVGVTNTTLSITVIAVPSGFSYSTNPAIYTTNIAITPDTPAVIGTVAGYSITPALSAGLSFNTTTGAVSGIPTAAKALTTYAITVNNGAGGTVTLNLNITVNASVAVSSHEGSNTLTFRIPGSTSFAFNTDAEKSIQLSIVNIWGRTVWSQTISAAREIVWNGLTIGGHPAAHGIYLVRIVGMDSHALLMSKPVAYMP